MPGTIRFRLSPEAQRLLSPILGEKQVAGAVIEQQTFDAISPALQQVLSDCAHDSFDEQSARMARAAAELGGHATTTPLSAAELMAAARGFRDAADFAGTRLHDPTRETRYRAQAALLDWERLAAPGAEPVVDARRALERNGADARKVAALFAAGGRPTEVASVVESLAELMAKEGLSTVPLGLARALMRGGHEAREVGAYLAAAKENRQLGAARIAVLLLEHLETSGQSLPALTATLRQLNADADLPAFSAISADQWRRSIGDALEGGASYAEAKAIVAHAAGRGQLGALLGIDGLVQLLAAATKRGTSLEAAGDAVLTLANRLESDEGRARLLALLLATNADLPKAAANLLEELPRAFSAAASKLEARLGRGESSARPGFAWLASQLVLVAQDLHDVEAGAGDGDVARSALFGKLSVRAAFQMLGLGEQLYTSSFLKLLERWRTAADPPGMAAWLATARVDEAALVGLRDNLARFRRADEAFTLRAALLPQMISHFSTAPATAGLLGAQVSLAADVHARMELGERLQFEEQLLAAHSARPRAPAIPYLLRFLYEQRRAGPQVEKVAKVLPPLPAAELTRRLKQWLKDGALTARLFFYPDEESFDEALEVFRKAGFRVASQDADNAILERANGPGPLWRVSMTRDPEADRSSALSDDRIDIVAHRGHSFHFEKTFSLDDTVHYGSSPKLLIGGSCGSLRDMAQKRFLEIYGRHALIADVGTGTGVVNNQVLLDLFAGLSSSPSNWKDVGLEKYASEDIVPPDHLIWGLQQYASRLRPH